MNPVSKKALEALRRYISTDVASGLRDEDGIAEDAASLVADDYPAEDIQTAAITMTRELLAEHRLAQESWPETTDCDRLDAAFDVLESAGILCRQDFSCCGTCGSGEILTEMEAAAAEGRDVRGYAFYHCQDTESAIESGGLHLNYGTGSESEAAALEIGHEVSAALRQQGLRVDWNGAWDKRIGVSLDWKRRR